MKRLICTAIFAIFFAAWTYDLCAATRDVTPVVYKVTVRKVELYDSATAAWVTVGEGDAAFDIASVGAGSVAGSYISARTVPEGDYTRMRLTLGRNVTVKATALLPDDPKYTTSTQIMNGADTAILGSGIAGDYAEGTAVIPAATPGVIGDVYIFTGDFPSTLTVRKGTAKKTRVKFDLANTVRFDDGPGQVIVYPRQPSVFVQVME
ncbi:MAG TPA: hypothetical protein PK587_06005 [Syntrophales bacterium]|nr:hypothetical protein [Syntrophales bacterium]